MTADQSAPERRNRRSRASGEGDRRHFNALEGFQEAAVELAALHDAGSLTACGELPRGT